MKSQNGGVWNPFDYLKSNGKSTENPLDEAIEKLKGVNDTIDKATENCKGDMENGTTDLFTDAKKHLTEAINSIKSANNICIPNQDAVVAVNADEVVEEVIGEADEVIGDENAGGSNRKSRKGRKGKKSRKFALKCAKKGRKTVKKGRKSEWTTFVTSVYKKNKLTNPMYMFKNALKDAAKIYKK
jgi:hypothetical protein